MNENLGMKGATFGAGVTAPFVASLPAGGSGAPAALCRADHRVVAAPSVPLGVRGLHHGCGRSMGASSYCLSERWRKTDQKHFKEKTIVR